MRNIISSPVVSFSYFSPFIGPSCRGPISKDRTYLQAAFEPVEPIFVEDSDDEDIKPSLKTRKRGRPSKGKGKAEPEEDVKPLIAKEEDMDTDSPIKPAGRRSAPSRAAKGRAVQKLAIPILDSDSDDSMDDFIVEDGEDEDEKDRIRAERAQGRRTRSSTRRSKYVDDEGDEDYGSQAEESEEDEPAFGGAMIKASEIDESALKPMAAPLERFLPSAKMLVCICAVMFTFSISHSFLHRK